MTQEEIEELRLRIANTWTISIVQNCLMQNVLKRLAVLEAAVAWHGFDEVPETGSIELLYVDDYHNRSVHTCMFHGLTELFICQHATYLTVDKGYRYWNRKNEYSAENLKRLGFTGWRYSIGDLGGKE